MSPVMQQNAMGVSPPEHPDTACPSKPQVTSTGSEASPHACLPSSTTTTIPSTVTVPTKQRSTKAKHKKPQGMPRRPLSAYNFFYKAERVKWLEEQKEKKEQESSSSTSATNEDSKKSDFLEMGKAISQRWRMLTNEARGPFEKEAKQDLIRYHQEMDAFNMSLVRSYQGPVHALRPQAPLNRHEVSPSQGSRGKPSESPSGSNQNVTSAQTAELSLANCLQLLLPLLQAKSSAPPPPVPSDSSSDAAAAAAAVFQTLAQQAVAQRLTQERVTEIRALLAELEQILVLQLQLEQHLIHRPVPPNGGGVNEACSALLSLVNQLR